MQVISENWYYNIRAWPGRFFQLIMHAHVILLALNLNLSIGATSTEMTVIPSSMPPIIGESGKHA